MRPEFAVIVGFFLGVLSCMGTMLFMTMVGNMYTPKE